MTAPHRFASFGRVWLAEHAIVQGLMAFMPPKAMTIPAPESRSKPAASMSRADALSAARIWAGVGVGLNERSRAAMAAAWGAAAEVPKNGLKPGIAAEEVTPSAAVMSGFWRTVPPVDEKFPGVIGVPPGVKNIRRGPSELKVSTGFVTPPTKAAGAELATSVAATLKALAAPEAL